jgi:hypothetical protein
MISTAMFLELNILHMDILGKLQDETKQQVRSGLQACNCNTKNWGNLSLLSQESEEPSTTGL